MSITGEGLVPLLLFNNMRAEYTRQTKLFVKQRVMRLKIVFTGLLQRRRNEEVNSPWTIIATFKTIKASRDYNNPVYKFWHLAIALLNKISTHATLQESVIVQIKKLLVTRLIEVTEWGVVPHTPKNRYSATSLFWTAVFKNGILEKGWHHHASGRIRGVTYGKQEPQMSEIFWKTP